MAVNRVSSGSEPNDIILNIIRKIEGNEKKGRQVVRFLWAAFKHNQPVQLF